ncbi:hypothetical protein HS088_TW04G01209 [Tripterygium wilfordii]|uniref:Uncharacterized protein n=1 Tax=Tripterygium wilfordii TaxID=458696 RepID=A0A7J7DSX2_TRIWF|nr:hypothetical protein HS088_TW04G01209 [Tripterygium wilfordii]
MALQLPHITTTQAGLTGMTVLFCAFALFMCAKHSRKWRRWRACFDSYDQHHVVHLNNEAVMGGFGGGNGDETMFSGELWQKNILMGGKCQLPDFSGVIIYDSNGNAVAPSKTPRPLLTWK